MIGDEDFYGLLARRGYSGRGYRRVRRGVKRRLVRHMQELGCRRLADYAAIVDADPAVRAEFTRKIAVCISRLFRDRRLWEVLGEKVLPELVAAGPSPVVAWSAGCARGEEVYSLRILWERAAAQMSPAPRLIVLATDIHPEHLAQAREGSYAAASLKEVPPEAVAVHFTRRRRRYRVNDALRRDILWARHDLADPPPVSGCRLLFLRNSVLTYLADPGRRAAFCRACTDLEAGGFVAVGAHEEVPFRDACFRAVAGCRLLWRKRRAANQPLCDGRGAGVRSERILNRL